MESGSKAYSLIYADPPWKYAHSRSKSRSIEAHYDTLDPGGIYTFLDTHGIEVAKDAVLFLWGTAPKLKEALQTIHAWGFTYKTHAVWDKEIEGMGYWFRGQHELLLVGTRGKVSPPLPSQRVSSVFRKRRGAHSAKPEEVRLYLEHVFPEARAIELFARWPGDAFWDVVGDEAGKVH